MGLEFGYVSLHDPTTGEWWDVKVKDAPGGPWVKRAGVKLGERDREALVALEVVMNLGETA